MPSLAQLSAIVERTAQYHLEIDYGGLGLCSEAGEVAGELKKVIRNDHGVLTEERCAKIASELGDVLWYTQFIANMIGYTIPEIVHILDDKLSSRLENGTINER